MGFAVLNIVNARCLCSWGRKLTWVNICQLSLSTVELGRLTCIDVTLLTIWSLIVIGAQDISCNRFSLSVFTNLHLWLYFILANIIWLFLLLRVFSLISGFLVHVLVIVLPLNFASHFKRVLHVKWIYLSFKNVYTSLTSSWNTTEAIMMRGDRGELSFFHYAFDGLPQSGEFARGNRLPIVFMDVFDITRAASDNLDYIFKNGSFFSWCFVWKGWSSSCIAYLACLDSWNCFLFSWTLPVLISLMWLLLLW